MSNAIARPARADDAPPLSQLDLTYETGRALVLDRDGAPPELTFTFEWRAIELRTLTYATYSEARLRDAFGRVAAAFVAELDGAPVGLALIVAPNWTDAGEITDLAVDRTARRSGAGRTLVAACAAWARERGLRALWVEPRADNAPAIDFYARLGFRLAGFNDRMYSNRDDEPGRTTLLMYLKLDSGTRP